MEIQHITHIHDYYLTVTSTIWWFLKSWGIPVVTMGFNTNSCVQNTNMFDVLGIGARGNR